MRRVALGTARFGIDGKGEGQAGFFVRVIVEVAVYDKALTEARLRRTAIAAARPDPRQRHRTTTASSARR